MDTNIIKELYTKNVPGKLRPLFFDRLVGVRDYREAQVDKDADNTLTTPWIYGRYEGLAEYESKIYNKVDLVTESIAKVVASESKELDLIIYRVPNAVGNTECSERQADWIAKNNEKGRERENQILLHLAVLKSELEMIDAALRHHIQRAENCNQKHIYAYWGGVLKAAGQDGKTDLPKCPKRPMQTVYAKEIYDAHIKNIYERINDSLEGRSINEQDQ